MFRNIILLMQDEPADICFRADLSKIDWLQGFDENKRLLVKLLDK